MEILKRISLIIFLLLMAAVYLPIGLWAIIAPAQDALGLELPSFYEAVGLSVISPIGYSEFAGIYGGINIVIGLMFLICLLYTSPSPRDSMTSRMPSSA